MKPRDLVPPRSARTGRLAGAAAIVAALALAAMPAVAGAQGAGQYEPSPPPSAGGDDPVSSGTPSTGTGTETFGSSPTADAGSAVDGTGSSSASDTVTESSGAAGELPVTGLPAVPIAVAGLVMLLLGSLGLRRFSERPGAKGADPDDPSGTRRILGR